MKTTYKEKTFFKYFFSPFWVKSLFEGLIFVGTNAMTKAVKIRGSQQGFIDLI